MCLLRLLRDGALTYRLASACSLGPFGSIVPTQQRRHIGRCVLVRNMAYSLNASSPEERWAEVAPVLQAVVSTFRAA
jgi:hypothetical protein